MDGWMAPRGAPIIYSFWSFGQAGAEGAALRPLPPPSGQLAEALAEEQRRFLEQRRSLMMRASVLTARGTATSWHTAALSARSTPRHTPFTSPVASRGASGVTSPSPENMRIDVEYPPPLYEYRVSSPPPPGERKGPGKGPSASASASEPVASTTAHNLGSPPIWHDAEDTELVEDTELAEERSRGGDEGDLAADLFTTPTKLGTHPVSAASTPGGWGETPLGGRGGTREVNSGEMERAERAQAERDDWAHKAKQTELVARALSEQMRRDQRAYAELVKHVTKKTKTCDREDA
eukprot:1176706-Prorocentrum_minimum.AAC.1